MTNQGDDEAAERRRLIQKYRETRNSHFLRAARQLIRGSSQLDLADLLLGIEGQKRRRGRPGTGTDGQLVLAVASLLVSGTAKSELSAIKFVIEHDTEKRIPGHSQAAKIDRLRRKFQRERVLWMRLASDLHNFRKKLLEREAAAQRPLTDALRATDDALQAAERIPRLLTVSPEDVNAVMRGARKRQWRAGKKSRI